MGKRGDVLETAPADDGGSPLGGSPLGDVDPTWRKAPTLLVRFPAVLAAVVVAALVVGVTSAVAPLFLSSAGASAMRFQIDRATPERAGLSVQVYASLGGSGHEDARTEHRRREEILAETVRPVTGLGDGALAVLGPTVTLHGPGGATVEVRLAARSAFQDALVGADGTGEGLWIPAEAAAALGGVGPTVRVTTASARTETAVAGTYERVDADPRTFWGGIAPQILGVEEDSALPVAITDVETLFEVGGELGEVGLFAWNYPLSGSVRSLPDADLTAGAIRGAMARLRTTTDPEVESLFGGATEGSALTDLVTEARAVTGSLRAPVVALSLTGRVVALALLGAVGVYAVRRRRGEVVGLASRGVAPSGIGARVALAALVPIALGAAAGWFAARWLVAELGPGRFDDSSATVEAIVQTAITALVGLALLGMVTAVTAHRESGEPSGSGRARELAARTPWDLILLLLAAVALLEARSRPPGRQGGVDLLVLVFPLLFLSGAAGVATRGLARWLPRAGAAAGHGGPGRFLAVRRLAAAGRTALLLVAGASVAGGLLVYAATLSTSARATSEASARVLVGASTRALLEPHEAPPGTLALGSSAVTRASGSVLPDRTTVDVLAIDPATFADAAAWDASFAAEPLDALLGRLDVEPGADELPVIAVGVDVPEGATIQLGPARAPVAVTAVVDAFPGMPEGRGMVVASHAALLSVVDEVGGNPRSVPGRTEVWSSGDEATLDRALGDAGVGVERVDTVARAAETLRFVALRWALGLLLALGALTGLIALAGVLLYLQSRQKAHEVSYAIASRMGLSAGEHGRSVMLELGGLLGVALVLGVGLALVAGLLVKSELDLLPSVPPDAILRIPWAAIGAAAGAALLAVLLGALRARFAADRTNVAEVLRLAE